MDVLKSFAIKNARYGVKKHFKHISSSSSSISAHPRPSSLHDHHRYYTTSITSSSHHSASLYVHWPYCKSICPYCDFNRFLMPSSPSNSSSSSKGLSNSHDDLQSSMRISLLSELLSNLNSIASNSFPLTPTSSQSRLFHSSGPILSDSTLHHPSTTHSRPTRITSIFFGGGTPSLANPQTIGDIIQTVKDWNKSLSLSDDSTDLEITLEANPTSIETSKLKLFKEAGVNRLSMGIQSLDQEDLKFLGRNHSVSEALHAYSTARSIFNDRVSFDLIYGRHENHTAARWRSELRNALTQLRPTHISLYSLTFEPGTPFHHAMQQGKIKPPSHDLSAELYEVTLEETERAGLAQYEISNFSMPGHESRHNINYWQLGDYIGIGPGAASRISIHKEEGEEVGDGKESLKTMLQSSLESNRGSGLMTRKLLHRVSGMCTKSVEKWKKEVGERGFSGKFEVLTPHQSLIELFLTGLRTSHGIPISKIYHVLALEPTMKGATSIQNPFTSLDSPFAHHLNLRSLNHHFETGNLVLSHNNPNSDHLDTSSSIRATGKGRILLDSILEDILL